MSRAPRLLRRFVQDRSGTVATLTGVALIGLVAIGGLAFDVSRALALRAELENAVDAAALAGASQLDGTSGAMGRAQTAAMGSLVSNRQALGDTYESNVAVAASDITFLSSRDPDVTATTDATAKFIRINLAPRSRGLVFGALTGVAGFNATARAVAGYGTAICKVPPLMICNPNESTSLVFDGDTYIGKNFVLTPPPGGNGAWGPGNFGFLSVGSGAADVKNAMGRYPPLTECFGTTVQTQTGNIASADDYFNVRFDIYKSSASGLKNDPLFRPAMNTLVGAKTNAGNSACNPSVSVPSNSCSSSAAVAGGMGLPRDCNQTGTVGSGVWNKAQYFATNHSGINPTTYIPQVPAGSTGTGWNAYGPAPAAGATSPTRYQVYKWELAMLSGAISTPAGAFSDGQTANSGSHDYAAPQCNKNGGQATPDRRTISAVVVNCNADNVHGSSTVHVIAYVDLFLIGPAVSNSIYGEVIGATTDTSAVGAETMLYSVRLYD
ncbi:hypothetical protein SGCZBJ_16490 [Caulobacter zeae]|uniref:Putative Flp pilus-assembly TadG-like N-terminal domain-containing protein n=1 Tax=Caulobacter zeae TaxID=2055137 RepID=A0A2N5DA55_9CAUL|nr:hypothetical protein SGCZBJ_16490 [Caulobacter zeae]